MEPAHGPTAGASEDGCGVEEVSVVVADQAKPTLGSVAIEGKVKLERATRVGFEAVFETREMNRALLEDPDDTGKFRTRFRKETAGTRNS